MGKRKVLGKAKKVRGAADLLRWLSWHEASVSSSADRQ